MGLEQLTELFGPAGYILGLMFLGSIYIYRKTDAERLQAVNDWRLAMREIADRNGTHATELFTAVAALDKAREAMEGR